MPQQGDFPEEPLTNTTRLGFGGFPDNADDPLGPITEVAKEPAEEAARVCGLRLKTGLPEPVIRQNRAQIEAAVALPAR